MLELPGIHIWKSSSSSRVGISDDGLLLWCLPQICLLVGNSGVGISEYNRWNRVRLENIQCFYLEVLKYLTLFTSIHQCNFSSKYLSIFIRFWIWCVLTKQILGKIMPWCSNQLRIVIFAMFSKKMFSNPISKETGQMHWLTCRSHSRHSRQQSAWENICRNINILKLWLIIIIL